ncbi:MAG: translocation and assembly module TamB, partial [Myxococcales bacterium]|nr:translocation and assembly module TamB [Myxococcales bacterium]
HQDLARMSSAPERLAARGNASVALRVESPDLTTFRTVADVRVEGADLRLPGYGVIVEGADGEVPITVSLRAGPHGIRMIREDQDNPYSSLRFADQHPLLSRSSFISIRRLTLPQVTISPLAGNLQIEQNILSLRQFEIGIRGGRVTGQCALDWNGQKSTLDMHVRADGVQSSHGEPFTGSAALVVSAAEHSIEGRADILQIGKRHLLDLLDLEDPFHADAAINKIRSSMSYGYPDKLRVTFNHGFASVHVAFGGLAGLISVGDLRGLPIGPLIDRLIPLYLPSKDEP